MMFFLVDAQVVNSAISAVALMTLKTPGTPVLVFYVSLQAPVVAEILLARVAFEVPAHVETLKPAS